MSKPLNPLLASVALLTLAAAAWSSANAQFTSNETSTSENRDLAGKPTPASGAYASEVPGEEIANQDQSTLATDKEEQTIPVAEEVDFVKGNSFRKPFEESLKAVARVDYYGTRYVDCEHYPLEIHTARPNDVRVLMKTGDSAKFEGSRSDRGVKLRGTPQGLGVEEERALLATFAFDTPVLELEKNPHAFKPLGMQKLPGILAWKLQVDRPGSYYRILYVDSHYGDIVRFILMNAQGARVLDVALHDYREVEGIRVPFSIDYRGANGTLLASDRLERVAVTRRQLRGGGDTLGRVLQLAYHTLHSFAAPHLDASLQLTKVSEAVPLLIARSELNKELQGGLIWLRFQTLEHLHPVSCKGARTGATRLGAKTPIRFPGRPGQSPPPVAGSNSSR